MILKLEESHDSIVGFEMFSNVSRGEYLRLIHEVRVVIARLGRVNLLVKISDLLEGDPGLIDEWLQFLADQGQQVKRYAVVGDHYLGGTLTALVASVTGIEVRHFYPSNEEQAWAWLKS